MGERVAPFYGQQGSANREVVEMEEERTTRAARFGRWLGHRWRGILSFEKNSLLWLQRVGVPINVAKIFGWILKAVILGALLYAAFWVALLTITIIVVGSGLFDCDEDFPEWRSGPEGYGYYENGRRTDYGRLFEEDD